LQRRSHSYKAAPGKLAIGLMLCLLPWIHDARAAENDQWALCKPQDVIPLPAVDGDPDKAPLRVSADKATSTQDKGLKLEGDVRIQQGQRLLLADQVDYAEAEGEFNAEGNVVFRNENFQLNSDSARVNLNTQQGVYDKSHYQYTPHHASGDAVRILSKDADHQEMQQVSYSTCDPDDVVWKLQADRIELDQTTHQGYAHDIALYLKGVPVFYFPYLRFPISEDRMSGFLFPEYTAINGNSMLSIPYYWNMAPNYDMTITPRFITNRGVMLDDEFRYLTQRSHGNLEFEYLPDDRLTGSDRGRFSYTHDSSFATHWHANAQFNYVSESSYYTDMGQNYDLSRNPFLRNSLETNYSGSRWNFGGRLEAYQILSGADQYQRMPQLSLSLKPAGNNRLNALFSSEYNYFYSADSAVHPIVGSRLDTTVGLSYPYSRTAGFIKPTLSWNTTQYELENRGSATTSTPTRDVPVFSLDSGLFLERPLANNTLMQTLEPRLYYLYVPYVDQSGLPNFDSSAYTFDFNQLFRDNRFSGSDRIGDANQLTVAATTRFLSTASGTEFFNLSLGQILYFADRQVNLDGSPPQTAGSSNYVAQMGAQLSRNWQWKSTLLWDPASASASTFNNRLQYKADRTHIANIDYRSTSAAGSATLNQLDLSSVWKLGARWRIFGRYYYDLLNQETIDTMYGFGYESCCWALRLTKRDYRPSTAAAVQNTLYLEFVFKGLASAGSGSDALLKSGILGYEPEPR